MPEVTDNKSRQDKIKEQFEENLNAVSETLDQLSEIYKKYYDKLQEKGFTKEEAFELIKNVRIM